MRLGATLPLPTQYSTRSTGDFITTIALRIEAAGYDSLWTFDAVGRGETWPDPLTLVAVAAAVTENIELGIGVMQLPLRQTVDLAVRIMTSHAVCGERLLLGVGCGSTAVDFQVMGGDYRTRQKTLQQQLPVLRKLVAEGRDDSVDLSPWPLQSAPPKWLLGTWDKHIEQAATEFDGWIASAHYRSDAELTDALPRYRAAGGQRAIATNIVLETPAAITGVAQRLENLAAAGFDDGIVCFAAGTEHLVDEVRSLV